jgi:N-acetylglucosamine-6-sulfatase
VVQTRRQAVLIEYFRDTVFPRIRKMGYSAVRTNRWKYIHYWSLPGADELYDLATDPYELVNRISARDAPLQSMKRRLNGLLRETGDSRHVA